MLQLPFAIWGGRGGPEVSGEIGSFEMDAFFLQTVLFFFFMILFIKAQAANCVTAGFCS